MGCGVYTRRGDGPLSSLFTIMKQCHFVWVSLVAALASGAEPERGATNSLAVAEIVAEALEKNPELKFYEAEIAAAKAGRKAAGLLPNPEVSGSVGHKRVRGSDMSAEGVAWAVSVVQQFEWPGRLGLRKAIANRDVELAELGLERFRLGLATRLRSLAFSLSAAEQLAATAEEVSRRLRAVREVLVQRDPAALTPLLEMRVIEASELVTLRKASEAGVELQRALAELNQLRGESPATLVRIAPPELAFRRITDASELVARARTNSFEVRQRQTELAQQGFKVALAKNERFPALAVGPSYSEERAGDEERIIGVQFSVPIPAWNRNTGNIEAAKAREFQAETTFLVTQREVEQQIVEAIGTYQRKVGEMERWHPETVSHFREAAELADRHYRLGAVPVSTYVELQDKYLEAMEALLDTRKQALAAAGQIETLAGLSEPLVQPAEAKAK